jgi:hypothetical protein
MLLERSHQVFFATALCLQPTGDFHFLPRMAIHLIKWSKGT